MWHIKFVTLSGLNVCPYSC